MLLCGADTDGYRDKWMVIMSSLSFWHAYPHQMNVVIQKIYYQRWSFFTSLIYTLMSLKLQLISFRGPFFGFSSSSRSLGSSCLLLSLGRYSKLCLMWTVPIVRTKLRCVSPVTPSGLDWTVKSEHPHWTRWMWNTVCLLSYLTHFWWCWTLFLNSLNNTCTYVTWLEV